MAAVETIAVRWVGGRESSRAVEARRTAVPELWIHRTVGAPSNVRWTVTHRPTGGAVARFRTLREARSCCKHLAELEASWDFRDETVAGDDGREQARDEALRRVAEEEKP